MVPNRKMDLIKIIHCLRYRGCRFSFQCLASNKKASHMTYRISCCSYQPQQLSFIKSYFYSVIRSFWATRLFNHKIRMLLGQQNHRRRQKQLRMSRYISAGHIFNAQNQISFIVCLLETILTPCTRRFNDDITKSSIFEFFRSQK